VDIQLNTSPNFGTDQLENGNPRSWGFDKATSTNSKGYSILGELSWNITKSRQGAGGRHGQFDCAIPLLAGPDIHARAR
jgi:hypothetical protein